MRIIGGKWRGHRIQSPESSLTRPTSDRVREAIASALESRNRIDQVRVLDLFAGTGALSFEALSRGASFALAIDHQHRAIRNMQIDAKKLKLDTQFEVRSLDLFKSSSIERLKSLEPFDLVFVDPPYHDIEKVIPLLDQLRHAQLFSRDALIVLECAARNPPIVQQFALIAQYDYGDTRVLFLEAPNTHETL